MFLVVCVDLNFLIVYWLSYFFNILRVFINALTKNLGLKTPFIWIINVCLKLMLHNISKFFHPFSVFSQKVELFLFYSTVLILWQRTT